MELDPMMPQYPTQPVIIQTEKTSVLDLFLPPKWEDEAMMRATPIHTPHILQDASLPMNPPIDTEEVPNYKFRHISFPPPPKEVCTELDSKSFWYGVCESSIVVDTNVSVYPMKHDSQQF